MKESDDFRPGWSLKPYLNTGNGSSGMELVCRPGGEVLVPGQLPTPHAGKLSLKEYFTSPRGVQTPAAWQKVGIGTLAHTPVWLTVAPPALQEVFPSHRWSSIRLHLAHLSPSEATTLTRASMLSSFIHNHQYCGRCGAATRFHDTEPCSICIACGLGVYPRISPAIIVLILSSDRSRVLLAHNKEFRPGLYSCVAGFVEAGESAEHTVIREIWEEVGLKPLTAPRYIMSQSWPFPHSLMLGYEITAEGTACPDHLEISDARWFPAQGLPMLPRPGSLSRILIDKWLDSLENRMGLSRKS